MSSIQQMMIGSSGGGTTLMSALTTAALTTNLKLCLDAGDSASYDPGVQTDKWLDRSGGGYDFYRGSGTGSDAADPTFNGSGGVVNSYWSFDGGDYFTYDTTNETWMQTLHKNGAVFSAVWFYYKGATNNATIIGTNNTLNTGIELSTGGSIVQMVVLNAGALGVLVQSDAAITTNGWHMVGVSVTENGGASGAFFYVDGGYAQVSGVDTWNPNYTSPSAGNAGNTMTLCSLPATNFYPSANKLSCLAVWQGTALTKANMDTIWAAMRGKFGI